MWEYEPFLLRLYLQYNINAKWRVDHVIALITVMVTWNNFIACQVGSRHPLEDHHTWQPHPRSNSPTRQQRDYYRSAVSHASWRLKLPVFRLLMNGPYQQYEISSKCRVSRPLYGESIPGHRWITASFSLELFEWYQMFTITFISGKCQCRMPAVTLAKYRWDYWFGCALLQNNSIFQ